MWRADCSCREMRPTVSPPPGSTVGRSLRLGAENVSGEPVATDALRVAQIDAQRARAARGRRATPHDVDDLRACRGRLPDMRGGGVWWPNGRAESTEPACQSTHPGGVVATAER